MCVRTQPVPTRYLYLTRREFNFFQKKVHVKQTRLHVPVICTQHQNLKKVIHVQHGYLAAYCIPIPTS